MNLAARERWPGFAAELEERSGLPTGYRESGALVVAADRDDAEELRRLHEFQRSLGLESDWLGPARCRRARAGALAAHRRRHPRAQDAHADPRAAVARARGAAVASGELRRGGRGDRARSRARDRRAHRGAATFGAGAVVVAAGAWSPALAPDGAGPPVRPVKGQILELRVRGAAGRAARRGSCARRAATWSRAATGASCSGATVEEQGFDTDGHRRRRLPPARGGLGGAARGGRAGAGRGARGSAPGHARQRAGGRARRARRACLGDRATTATACCWRR